MGIITVVAAVLAFTRRPYRKDLAILALLLPLGVAAQAVLGGFTVLNHLAPGFVMAHFSLSLIILDRRIRAGLASDIRARDHGHVATTALGCGRCED